MSMDYFRRPQLAGNNLTRTNRATVRGSVRRSDADGLSTIPYFPSAIAGQTLLVAVDGAAATTVTLTDSNAAGSGITQAIADLNTTLAPGAEAFDSDGTISIRSTGLTGAASIEVTGGTAAVALGFKVALGKIRSVLGEIPSTPEGRVGNWFGTSFPDKGEGLSAESVNRGMARLAANADILFADNARAEALPKKISYTTLDNVSLVPASANATRVFTGLGLLSSTSPKEVLSRFFFLVDQATNLPPASRVVGVVRGSPAGLPPYSDASTWTGGGATGNVLGVDLTKSSLSITSISNGRVIECAGASFLTTSKVVPGDYVEISGSTNITPWSNNGYRWVVEEVITETTLAVRPMSKSELSQFGPVTTEEQPLLELNAKKSGGEVYGSAIVRTGSFCNDVKLVVDPPIPAGSTYDLYVSVPGDSRSRQVHEAQAHDVLNGLVASDLRPEPNALLVPPTVTAWTTGNVSLSSGYGRFSGRVVSIPARTLSVFSNGLNYVYWDKDANDVKVTTSHVKVVYSDPTQAPGSSFSSDTRASQHIIAEVVKSGGIITSVQFQGRALAEEGESRVVTVGVGGQFSKLEDAIHFINRWAKGNNLRADYPQFEIVIISDTTVDLATVSNNTFDYVALPTMFLYCSVKIRGATPDMPLRLKNWSSYVPFDLGGSGSGTFVFEDLTLYLDGTFSTVQLFYARAGTSCFFKNVNIVNADFGSFGAFYGSQVVVDSCTIHNLKSSFMPFISSATNAEIFNSSIHMAVSPASTPILFGSPGAPVQAKRLTVRDCEFHRLSTDQGYAGEALMGKFGHFTVFDGCSFERYGSNTAGVDSVLFKQLYVDGPLFISKCKSLNPTRCFIDVGYTQENFCTISDCIIWVEPDAGNPGIRCGSIKNSTILGVSGTNPTLIEAMRECSGNYILGTSAVAVKGSPAVSGSTFFTNITDNRIEVSGGVSIQVWTNNPTTSGVNVSGNQIKVAGTGAVGIETFSGFSTLLQGTISGNMLRISTADFASNKVGIWAKGAPSIIGNQIFLAYGESISSSGHIGIKIEGSAYPPRVLSNTVVLGSGNFTSISIEGAQPGAIVQGNYISSNGTGINWVSPSSVFECIVSENYIAGSTWAVTNLAAGKFNNNFVQGYVTGPSVGVSNEVTGNFFISTVSLNGWSSRGMLLEKNTFSNGFTMASGYMDIVANNFSSGNVAITSSFVNFYDNRVTGVSQTVQLLSGGFNVERNDFAGTFMTTNITGGPNPTVVRGNRFLGNSLASVNVGQTFSEDGTILYFEDNYVTCSMNAFADFTTHFEVCRNYFGGTATMTEMDRLDGNYFGGAVDLTGRLTATGTPFAPANGNILIGSGNRSFTSFVMNGMKYYSSSGTNVFANCQITGSHFEVTGSYNLSNVNISDSRFEGTISATVSSVVQLSGLRVVGSVSLVPLVGADVHVVDSRIDSAFGLGGSVSANVTLIGVYAGTSFGVSNSAVGLTVSGCRGAGATAFAGVWIEMDSSRFDTTFTMTVSGNANLSSSILGTSTTSITSTGGFISGCWMGAATLSVGGGTIAASYIASGTIHTGTVTGCKISQAFTLGTNSIGDAYNSLIFSNNHCGVLYVNPYTNTWGDSQSVGIYGNTIKPSFASYGSGTGGSPGSGGGGGGGPLAGLFLQRGRGIVVSGNTIFGSMYCLDVGSSAVVTDAIIEGNYLLGETGDFGVPATTITASSNGFGLLANGTYRYLLIYIFDAGGHTANRPSYSKASLSSNVTLSGGSPNNGIDLNINAHFDTSNDGITFVNYEIWRTADGGATWYNITANIGAVNFLGQTSDFGGYSPSSGTPSLVANVNNTNNRPPIFLRNSYRTRVLANIMDKASTSVGGNDNSFIIVGSNAKGTLIGNNHFSGASAGITDDANTGTNEDDTYWTSAPTTTYASTTATGSGGTRRP
jgi:hypothetical protein